MTDVVLALGGGGVKGFAHIGVAQALEQNGFRVRAIAGSSAGGMVGSVLAAGYGFDEICDRLVKVDQKILYNRISGDGPGLLGFSNVARILGEFLGEKTFDDLELPFAVTAVNLETGQEEILNTGKVLDAVRATTAMPGIFPPVVWEGRTMIDGGVLDPVPVGLARKLVPSLPVVAVVLTPPLQQWTNALEPPTFLTSLPLFNQIYQLRLAKSFSIFLRSVDIGGSMLADIRLKADAPDIVIRPDVWKIGVLDRIDMLDVVQRGHIAAEAALPQVQSVVSKRKQPERRAWWNPFQRQPCN